MSFIWMNWNHFDVPCFHGGFEFSAVKESVDPEDFVESFDGEFPFPSFELPCSSRYNHSYYTLPIFRSEAIDIVQHFKRKFFVFKGSFQCQGALLFTTFLLLLWPGYVSTFN